MISKNIAIRETPTFTIRKIILRSKKQVHSELTDMLMGIGIQNKIEFFQTPCRYRQAPAHWRVMMIEKTQDKVNEILKLNQTETVYTDFEVTVLSSTKYTTDTFTYQRTGFINKQPMKIEKIWFDEANIYIMTDSGHTIGNPLSWYPRLDHATPQQREKYEFGPFAESIHWPELDEDLSLEGFFDFKRELHYAKI
jgi:Protein of unknown function (DUF2442)